MVLHFAEETVRIFITAAEQKKKNKKNEKTTHSDDNTIKRDKTKTWI